MTTVRDAIFSVTSDPNVQRAMLLGSLMEGGWSTPFPAGDNGTSLGPFQIHLPAHPGVTAGQANDPVSAARYMLPSYQAGVQRAGGAGTAAQAALAAFYAERPAAMYPSSRYESLWPQVTAAMSGAPAGGVTLAADTTSTTPDTSGGMNGVMQAIDSAFAPVGQLFQSLAWIVNPMSWLRIMLAILGAALFFGGLYFIGTAV